MGAKEVLEVVILVSGAEAIKGIGGVTRAFNDLGRNVLKGVAIGAVGAATALAGLGLALGKLALDAAPLEGIGNSFAGFTQDIEGGASDMLAALQEGSQGMISQRQLMLSFNNAAQLVGKDFAQTLPDAFGYLSKVAAATGQDMGFLSDSLVRGIGRLSPMILDNLGIQVDLNDAFTAYADANGLVASELSKTEQQTALTNAVMEALAKNTADLPETLGTVAQKLAAAKAQFSNVKDEVGLALMPALSSLLDAFGMIWADVGPKVIAFFQGSVAPVMERIGSVITAVADAGWGSIEFWEALGGLLGDDVVVQLKEVVAWIGTFIDEKLKPFVAEHGPALVGALKGIGIALAIGAAIATLVSLFTMLTNPITILIAVAGLLGAAWTSNWGGIQDKTKAVWAWMQPILKSIGDWLKVKIPEAIGVLKIGWGELSKFWTNTLKPVLDGIWKAIQKIATWIGNAITKVGDFIGSLGNLKNKLPDWLVPGSPTPLELGLRGITNAMGQLSSKALPGMASGFGALPATAAAGGGGGLTVVIDYRPVLSMADAVEVETRILPLIREGLRDLPA